MNQSAKQKVLDMMSLPLMQMLEDRRLLSAAPVLGTPPADGVLTIDGTAGNDNIEVGFYRDSREQILVKVNKTRTVYNRADITSIVIDGKEGNDRIQVKHKRTFDIPVSLSGGPGNDRLWGGAADDSLNGGSGKDGLWGFGGDDALDGGVGDDSVEGGNGDDRCRGGKGRDRVFAGGGQNIFYDDDSRGEMRDRSSDDSVRHDDDGPLHDLYDDHGSGGHGSDDGPDHDLNDDHGDHGPGHT